MLEQEKGCARWTKTLVVIMPQDAAVDDDFARRKKRWCKSAAAEVDGAVVAQLRWISMARRSSTAQLPPTAHRYPIAMERTARKGREEAD